MNIFEILNGKAIVAGDEDYGLVVAWNGSATFEIFDVADGLFRAIDVRTVHDVTTVEHARKVAAEFIEDMIMALGDENLA